MALDGLKHMRHASILRLGALLGVAFGASSAPFAIAAAQAEIIEHLDFDDAQAPIFTTTNEAGKFRVSEFSNQTHERRLFTLRTLGTGQEPRLVDDDGHHFLRFGAGRSSVDRDRSEIVIDQHLDEGRAYSVSFRLRLPQCGHGICFTPGQWFMLTQLQEVGGQGPPPLSISLRRDDDGMYIDIAGRNDEDAYDLLASMPIDNPANFTFGEWNEVRLNFRMGPAGFAELEVGNTARQFPLREVGAAHHRLTFARGGHRYVLRMGMYRGGPARDGYHVDMDDIVFASP